jgi:hypothetical protein
MKTTFLFIIGLLVFSNYSNARDELKTLELMAGKSIVYAIHLAELEKDPIAKANIINKLCEDCFCYMYETTYLGYKKFDNVEGMIRLLYIIAKESPDKEGSISRLVFLALQDPLDALKEDKNLTVRKHWKFDTKEEYKKILEEMNKDRFKKSIPSGL